MEVNKMFDPAGKVDLSELDALAGNDAAGATPVLTMTTCTVVTAVLVTKCVSYWADKIKK